MRVTEMEECRDAGTVVMVGTGPARRKAIIIDVRQPRDVMSRLGLQSRPHMRWDGVLVRYTEDSPHGGPGKGEMAVLRPQDVVSVDAAHAQDVAERGKAERMRLEKSAAEYAATSLGGKVRERRIPTGGLFGYEVVLEAHHASTLARTLEGYEWKNAA
jgi:hypothetical protein